MFRDHFAALSVGVACRAWSTTYKVTELPCRIWTHNCNVLSILRTTLRHKQCEHGESK